ncbi:AzlC family ABC transporter permease [Treponema primitia]|uniref:AzlC family ABC transporter permease n=1 Tax=Treponema primitia TaxID=88058 RepID=UPI0002555416|nr:AzlC family ABC transporter permease [Treponema primitia]
MNVQNNKGLFISAVKYSFPVLLGYLAIGIAAGLLLVDAGYPWWLSLIMSVVMYAGAGQYIAVGLFAAGAGLLEAALVQLVVNARHIAYGLTMFKRFNAAGPYKFYLIFALTDETFALLSSLPEDKNQDPRAKSRFMFLVALLDHAYWTFGAVIGALLGTLIPFSMEGISFALTALFIVLMIEQILRVKRPKPFIISALAAILGVAFLPSRLSLLSAMVIALVTVQLLTGKRPVEAGTGTEAGNG